jgi:hypothetical protein
VTSQSFEAGANISIPPVIKSYFRHKVSGRSKVLTVVFEPFQYHSSFPDRLGDRLGIGPAVNFGACKDESSRWSLDQEIMNQEDE